MGETGKRIIAGISIASIVIAALWLDVYHWIFPLVMVMFFSLMGLVEFYRLTDRGMDGRPFRKLGYFFSILIILAFYAEFLYQQALNGHELGGIHETFVHWFYPGQHNLTPGLLILFMVCIFVAQLFTRPIDGALYSMTTTLGGSLYTTLTTAHALLLFAYPKGVFYLTFFVVMPIAMDSGAYFAGRWFGRHNAGLKVSPKKTYEGYVGGIIFTVLVGIGWLYGWKNYGLESYRTLQMSYVEAGVYAFGLAILSIFGDLAESAFKRDAKTKDSASTIPGHGGMLDLADAIYLCIPFGYYIMLFRQMLGLSF